MFESCVVLVGGGWWFERVSFERLRNRQLHGAAWLARRLVVHPLGCRIGLVRTALFLVGFDVANTVHVRAAAGPNIAVPGTHTSRFFARRWRAARVTGVVANRRAAPRAPVPGQQAPLRPGPDPKGAPAMPQQEFTVAVPRHSATSAPASSAAYMHACLVGTIHRTVVDTLRLSDVMTH